MTRTHNNTDSIASQPIRRLLSTCEAAELLHTTERNMKRMWQERRIAGVKVGRSVRFTEEDLHAFIARNRQGALK